MFFCSEWPSCSAFNKTPQTPIPILKPFVINRSQPAKPQTLNLKPQTSISNHQITKLLPPSIAHQVSLSQTTPHTYQPFFNVQAIASIVACHRHDPKALLKSWDAVFIAVGSSSFAFGNTREKAIFRAEKPISSIEARAAYDGDKALPLQGCHPKAVDRHAGRSHVMAVTFSTAHKSIPEQLFAFENDITRDAFMQKLQVRVSGGSNFASLILNIEIPY